MPRYIDAVKLKDRMLNYYECVNADTNKSNYRGETLMNYEVADMIEDCIENAPTADVVEVVHGEWVAGDTIDDGWIRYGCSECDYNTDSYYKEKYDLHRYCPKCGAKMDGERKEK